MIASPAVGDDPVPRDLDHPDAALRLQGLVAAEDGRDSGRGRDRHRRVDPRGRVRWASALGRALRGAAHGCDVPRDGLARSATRAGTRDRRGARRGARPLLEQQERLLQNVSHELRTPVTIARGHLELLQRSFDKTGRADRRVRGAAAHRADRRSRPAAGPRRAGRLGRPAPDRRSSRSSRTSSCAGRRWRRVPGASARSSSVARRRRDMGAGGPRCADRERRPAHRRIRPHRARRARAGDDVVYLGRRTPGRESPPLRRSGSSSASRAPTPRVPAGTAAPGSACRSWRQSRAHTADRAPFGVRKARGSVFELRLPLPQAAPGRRDGPPGPRVDAVPGAHGRICLNRSVAALYRKYRPQTFAEVVGQEAVVRTLTNAIEQGKVRQAYLFAGPRGTGKTSLARILAKAVNCAHGPTATPGQHLPRLRRDHERHVARRDRDGRRLAARDRRHPRHPRPRRPAAGRGPSRSTSSTRRTSSPTRPGTRC